VEQSFQQMLGEQTLMLFKPDALKRGLVGVIFERLERAGLKIVACKLVSATRKQLNGHFHGSDEWVRGMGEKSLETYREYKLNPVDIFGTDDPFQIGLKLKEWNYYYLSLGPVMVVVLQGIHAIDTVRKLIGNTLPYKAMPGTIRGDFSINAPDLANLVGSACKNLVHASGNQAEAQQEIANWFEPAEILSWERADDFVHFIQGELIQNTPQETTMKYAVLEESMTSLKEEDPRNAAEYAYALAALYHRDGDRDKALHFGHESILLFGKCEMQTLEDCAARNTVIEGIAIPSIIHEEVVRERLQPLVL